MEDSYVCSGATMRCTMGTSQARLTVLPTRTVFLTGKPQANISDHLSMVNLGPFGRCRSLGFPATASATAAAHGKLTPMPCVHNTPMPWAPGKTDYLVQGQPALLKSDHCQCFWGGTISLVTDGQISTGPADLSKRSLEEFEKDQVSAEGLSKDDVLDGIQMALDVAGMVPVLGAAPDLLNAAISACRGNWLDAGMSLLAAVPAVGDVAGGAKIVKNGVKIAKDVDKARKAVLAKEAKKYISKEISKKELLRSGICQSEKEVEFFQKALRGERKDFAKDFYRRHGMTNKRDINSHLNGIDLNNPVTVKKVPSKNEKMTIYRYMERGSDNSVKSGAYFTDSPKYSQSQLGISNTYGKNGERIKEHFSFTVKEPSIDCLESTAKPIKVPKNGNWNDKSPQNMIQAQGGGKQLYMPINNLERRKKFLKTAKKL